MNRDSDELSRSDPVAEAEHESSEELGELNPMDMVMNMDVCEPPTTPDTNIITTVSPRDDCECCACDKKIDKIASLQKTRSKQRQRLFERNRRISCLQKENKNLKKVCGIKRWKATGIYLLFGKYFMYAYHYVLCRGRVV